MFLAIKIPQHLCLNLCHKPVSYLSHGWPNSVNFRSTQRPLVSNSQAGKQRQCEIGMLFNIFSSFSSEFRFLTFKCPICISGRSWWWWWSGWLMEFSKEYVTGPADWPDLSYFYRYSFNCLLEVSIPLHCCCEPKQLQNVLFYNCIMQLPFHSKIWRRWASEATN